MKTKFVNIAVLLLATSLLSGCFWTKDDIVEGDETAPTLTIVNPEEGEIFYTEGGPNTPQYVILEATATDESNIDLGRVTVYDSSNSVQKEYELRSSSINGGSVRAIYSSFKTTNDGNYRIVFHFEDALGNSVERTVNVQCVYNSNGDTDA